MEEARYVCSLSPGVQKKASEELNEVALERQSHIDTLRSWVLQQPHFKSRTDDKFLLQFLRVAKFSQLGARSRLEQYISSRCHPETQMLFCHSQSMPAGVMDAIRLGCISTLPSRLPQGPTLLFFQSEPITRLQTKYSANTSAVMEWVICALNSLVEILLAIDEAIQVHGFECIVNHEGFSLSQASYFTPGFIKRVAKVWLNTLPFRNKAQHFYKSPAIFNGIFEIAKLLFSAKMIKRVYFHKENGTLHSRCPKEVMPTEYGGLAGPFSKCIEHTTTLIQDNLSVLQSNAGLSFEESKRPKSDNKSEDLQASFRKLNVE